MFFYIVCSIVLGFACFVLGNSVGFVIGFRQAANDLVVKQLKDLEGIFKEVCQHQLEHPIAVINLDDTIDDNPKEPIN